MVKTQIIGNPARRQGKVVGTIRYTSEDDKHLGTYSFEEDLSTIAALGSTVAFETHAVDKMKKKLAAAAVEVQWATVQAMLAPLIVEEEE